LDVMGILAGGAGVGWLAQAASTSIVSMIKNPRSRSCIGAFPLVTWIEVKNLTELAQSVNGCGDGQQHSQGQHTRET